MPLRPDGTPRRVRFLPLASLAIGPTFCQAPLRRSVPLDDRPYLDTAGFGRRYPGGDGEGLIQVVDVDEKVPPKLLLGLRERAVRDRLPVVPYAHGTRHRGRL